MYPYALNESILDNTGGGVFVPFATLAGLGLTLAFDAADFDGDGDQDIVLGHRGGGTGLNGPGMPMEYLQNLGTGGFAAAVPIGSSHATWSLDVADFDGNGPSTCSRRTRISSSARNRSVACSTST